MSLNNCSLELNTMWQIKCNWHITSDFKKCLKRWGGDSWPPSRLIHSFFTQNGGTQTLIHLAPCKTFLSCPNYTKLIYILLVLSEQFFPAIFHILKSIFLPRNSQMKVGISSFLSLTPIKPLLIIEVHSQPLLKSCPSLFLFIFYNISFLKIELIYYNEAPVIISVENTGYII